MRRPTSRRGLPRSSKATTSSRSTSRRRCFNKPDPVTGEAKKIVYGPWMMRAFGVLAKLRRFRGTPLDLFGKTAERRMERALLGEYETLVAELVGALATHNHSLAVELAQVPEHIRGYGHVKDRHVVAAKKKEAELLAAFRAAKPVGPKDDGDGRRLNSRRAGGGLRRRFWRVCPSCGISQSVGAVAR